MEYLIKNRLCVIIFSVRNLRNYYNWQEQKSEKLFNFFFMIILWNKIIFLIIFDKK